jgi:hypothetical protein
MNSEQSAAEDNVMAERNSKRSVACYHGSPNHIKIPRHQQTENLSRDANSRSTVHIVPKIKSLRYIDSDNAVLKWVSATASRG